MENATTVAGANLREISLDEIERLTDLYLWGNVGADQFNNQSEHPERWRLVEGRSTVQRHIDGPRLRSGEGTVWIR